MLPDLSVIGNDFLGVKKVELASAGQPFETGTRLHVTMSALGRVVVAHIDEIDDEAFMFQSHFAGAGVSGEVTTQVHEIGIAQSRLEVGGDVRGNWLTGGLVTIGLTVFKQEGVRQVGQTLGRHAIARRNHA